MCVLLYISVGVSAESATTKLLKMKGNMNWTMHILGIEFLSLWVLLLQTICYIVSFNWELLSFGSSHFPQVKILFKSS